VTVGQSAFYFTFWEHQIIVLNRRIEAATTRLTPPTLLMAAHVHID